MHLLLLVAATTLAIPQEDKVQTLIDQLGSESPEKRAQTATELEKIGRPALDALRRASNDANPDRAAESAALVRKILFVVRGWIAFYDSAPQPEHPTGHFGIYVVDPDEGKPRMILGGIPASHGESIHWMPGVPAIALAESVLKLQRGALLTSLRPWIAKADETNPSYPGGVNCLDNFAISPDGKRIAYIAYGGVGGSNLWLTDFQGGNPSSTVPVPPVPTADLADSAEGKETWSERAGNPSCLDGIRICEI